MYQPKANYKEFTMKTHAAAAILATFALSACGSEGVSDNHTSSRSAELIKIAGDGDGCTTLFAGQSIDAGKVCLTVDNTVDTSASCGAGSAGVINVTYDTTGGWELVEAHLAAGISVSDIPLNKAGNPKIGNFPYSSGNIAGSTSYSFSVPLCTFALDASQTQCTPVVSLFAAHAALRKDKGDGTYQTETGWGDGDRFLAKGSWAEYFSVVLECAENPQPPEKLPCETAWAIGKYTFDCSVPNKANPDNYNCGPAGEISDKWGWYDSFVPAAGFRSTLYAGAAQNDLSKGTLAGTLDVTCAGTACDLAVQTSGAWRLEDFQAYVGCEPPTTTAPGQLGFNWSDDVNYADGDVSYVGSATNLPACSSGSYYIAVHTTVCRPAS